MILQFSVTSSSLLTTSNIKINFFINDGNKNFSLILRWFKYVDITKLSDNNVWKKCSFTY
jgi:hypothetical protein